MRKTRRMMSSSVHTIAEDRNGIDGDASNVDMLKNDGMRNDDDVGGVNNVKLKNDDMCNNDGVRDVIEDKLKANSTDKSQNSPVLPDVLPSPSQNITECASETETPISKDGNNATEDEPLAQIMKELKLYEELYGFMKSQGITMEALKFMKTRHIDELFTGKSINLKIIFEQRLLEWQERQRKQHDEKEISMKIAQKSCDHENCKLLSLERLMDAIQNSLKAVLGESSADHHTLNYIEQGNLNVPEEPQILVIEPVFTYANQTNNTEKLNIIRVETVPPAVTQLSMPSLNRAPCHEGMEESITDEITVQTESTSSQSAENEVNSEPKKEENPKTKRPSNQIISSNMLEPVVPKYTKRKFGIETDVREILLMYKPGNFILKYYKNFGLLTSKLRSDLVHIIVDHFILNNEFVCVTQCRALAKQIVELFPTENLETYFSQENRSITPRGKLWNHYQNERRMQKRDSFKQYTKSNRLSMESTCGHLKNIEDESFLLKKWNKTFQYRRYQLNAELFSNWKMYFDEYPFCKQQNYTLFIDADLATLYPDLTFNDQLWDDFLNNFQIYFWNRIKDETAKQLYDELCSMDELTTPLDYFPIRIIQLLHIVLNSSADYYLDDPLRQFTVEVSDLGELKEIVIERKKYCMDNNIKCKPYIAVVRENNTYVHYSVVLDSTGFGCDNYKESLILCFKLYLFFDISYPEESFHVWLFIQKYFFNKHSLIVEPSVNVFIDEVRSRSRECN